MKKGERVGAILSSDGKLVKFLGFGVYEGDKVPHSNKVKLFGVSLKEIGAKTPCIKLDNGKYVYGCECWWGKEFEVKKLLYAAEEVIEVDIDEERKKAG